MTEAKPFASLSSGLLARKGAAKPAMRPQGFGQLGMGIEDLGWNDMGHSGGAETLHEASRDHVPSSIAALTPAPAAPVEEALAPPPVVEQQREIEAHFAKAEAVEVPNASIVTLPPRKSAPRVAGAKAAFTLRLDPERHLKLRLACAVAGRSAQQIVTEALDAFLDSKPELDTLARHVPAESGR